jgi:peptidoglycan hydrolase CwlO-like protein
MSSIGELEAQIVQCQIRIEECQRKIQENQESIEQIMLLQGRIGNMEEGYDTEQTRRRERLFWALSGLSSRNRYSSHIIESYDGCMSELFRGIEHTRVVNGLEEAISVTSQKIQNLQYENETLREEISSLQMTIGRCQAEIAEIQRRDAEIAEMQRREAELRAMG